MKPLILLVISFLCTCSIFGQEEENVNPLFRISFNEFTISGNHTTASSNEDEGRFGCGAGIYHLSTLSKQWDYMYGLEYNYISFFAEYIYSDPHLNEENITFHIHTVSITPLSFRFSIGKNIKYFLDAGAYFGISAATKKGEASYNNIPVKPQGDAGVNFYPAFGMGVRIPMKKIEWVVKTDYRVGWSNIENYNSYQYYRLVVGVRRNASRK